MTLKIVHPEAMREMTPWIEDEGERNLWILKQWLRVFGEEDNAALLQESIAASRRLGLVLPVTESDP